MDGRWMDIEIQCYRRKSDRESELDVSCRFFWTRSWSVGRLFLFFPEDCAWLFTEAISKAITKYLNSNAHPYCNDYQLNLKWRQSLTSERAYLLVDPAPLASGESLLGVDTALETGVFFDIVAAAIIFAVPVLALFCMSVTGEFHANWGVDLDQWISGWQQSKGSGQRFTGILPFVTCLGLQKPRWSF